MNSYEAFSMAGLIMIGICVVCFIVLLLYAFHKQKGLTLMPLRVLLFLLISSGVLMLFSFAVLRYVCTTKDKKERFLNAVIFFISTLAFGFLFYSGVQMPTKVVKTMPLDLYRTAFRFDQGLDDTPHTLMDSSICEYCSST